MFIHPTRTYRKEGNRDETVYAKNRGANRARRASFRCRLVLEEKCHGKAEQRRLLHLHHAPLSEIAGPEGEMAHLLDGPRSGGGERRERSKSVNVAPDARNEGGR